MSNSQRLGLHHLMFRAFINVPMPVRVRQKVTSGWLRFVARPHVERTIELKSGGRLIVRLDDFVGYMLWVGLPFEKDYLEAFISNLRQGDTVFDVGGHFGLYAVSAALAVGSTGTVHVFEPGKTQASYLRRNKALNALTNLSIVEAAVSDRDGVAHFDESDRENLGHNRLSVEGSQATREVPLTTLDSYAQGQGIKGLDAMKIDVEGAEILALRGAIGLFGSSPPRVIQFECREFSHDYGATGLEVFDFLHRLGYKIGYFERGCFTTAAQPLPASFDYLAIRE